MLPFAFLLFFTSFVHAEIIEVQKTDSKFLPIVKSYKADLNSKENNNKEIPVINVKDINKFRTVNGNNNITAEDPIRSLEKIKVSISDQTKNDKKFEFLKNGYEALMDNQFEVSLKYYLDGLKFFDAASQKTNSEYLNVLLSIGNVYFMLYQFDLAIEYFTKIIAINDKYTKAWLNIFFSLEQMNSNKALEILDKLLKKFPSNHILRAKICIITLEKDQPAVDVCRSALDESQSATFKIRIQNSYNFALACDKEASKVYKQQQQLDEKTKGLFKEAYSMYKILKDKYSSDHNLAIDEISKRIKIIEKILDEKN